MADNKKGGGRFGRFLCSALALLLCVAAVLFCVQRYAAKRAAEKERYRYDSTLLNVFFLDVGQGDAILVRSPDGKTMLIDTGPESGTKKLTEALDGYAVETLDYLVLTHPDADHVGGTKAVLEKVRAESVLTSDVGADTAAWRKAQEAIEEEGCPLLTPRPGKTFAFGENCTVCVLAPEDTDAPLNDCSLVLMLTYGETSFLLTGDAESAEERFLVENCGEMGLSCDVLKVGHHGSASSTGETFLDAAKPSVAVISCGKDNDYGHPSGDLLRRLSERNITVLRTDEQGTVILSSNGKTVFCSNEEKSEK